MKFLLLFFFALNISAANLSAQDAEGLQKQYLNFSFLTIRDGLSQGMINYMMQDHFGFMWFGTKDGLNRYDGYRFVVYHNDATDPNSLSDNHIKSIYEDNKGRLWIGTATGGLELFDRDTEKFIHFKHSDTSNNTISDNLVTHITEDKEGYIWIITGRGIDRIVCNRFAAKNTGYRYQSVVAHINFPARSGVNMNAAVPLALQTVSPQLLFTDSKGIVWIFYADRGYYIRPAKDTFTVANYDLRQQVKSVTPNMEFSIISWAEDSLRGYLYFFSENAIFRIKSTSGTIDVVDRSRYTRLGISVQSAVDEEGILWFSDLGFLRTVDFDHNTQRQIYFANNGQLVDASFNVFRDRNDAMWIGTVGYGLIKHLPKTAKFHFISHRSVSHVTECFPDQVSIDGSEWDNQFFDFNLGSFVSLESSRVKVPVKLGPFADNSYLNYAGGHALVLQKSLYVYDKNYSQGKLVRNISNQRCVLSDEKGIWIGCSDSLIHFDEGTQQLTAWAYPVTPSDLPYTFCMMMIKDKQDNLWLASMQGLLHFNVKTHEWKQWRHIEKDTSSLSTDILFSLCADPVKPEKYLWIGTEGGGLNRFNIETGKSRNYREKDGLPNSVIYGIVADDNGNLWMSTNKGLSRFNSLTATFLNYDEADGLQSNEFNRYGFGKSKSGWLYFGGINGFNYFKGKDINTDTIFSKVIFTDFKINNKSAAFGGDADILSKPVFLTDAVTLPYEYNMISIDFAATNMALPAKNFYQYRMDGFDENWIASGTAHTATYTNLDPGTYTFHVRASNYQDVWGSNESILSITVIPPWYMTWWFRALLILTIAGGLYLLYRYRLNQALKLQSVRNRIASDLHDEIGSTLSSISIYSEVIDDRTKDSLPEVTPVIQRISESTENMMDAMSDIVWAINPGNDRFENILSRMQAFAAEILEAKNCMLHLQVDTELHYIKLGMETRKNFYLIFKEAVNNTAKYANARNVWIDMWLHNNQVHFVIKDDGQGFDIKQQKQGNGLNNIRKRTRELQGHVEIISEKGDGSSVKLNFPVA
ncbi:MAG TPA: two-component regulator propeller domain-containing protein [Panacibacter sp.]|nr:two-component regulator propeller domain-containing protein [Panacibacter sp.]HNP46247.1 two-component regulator propeller domain-containing protein [Panacibacter sp.]